MRLLAFAALAAICALQLERADRGGADGRGSSLCLAIVVAGGRRAGRGSRGLPASLARRRGSTRWARGSRSPRSALVVVGVPAGPAVAVLLGRARAEGLRRGAGLGNALYPYNGPVAVVAVSALRRDGGDPGLAGAADLLAAARSARPRTRSPASRRCSAGSRSRSRSAAQKAAWLRRAVAAGLRRGLAVASPRRAGAGPCSPGGRRRRGHRRGAGGRRARRRRALGRLRVWTWDAIEGRSRSTGTTATGRSTGRATARPCSRSSATTPTTGARRCSTASTGPAGPLRPTSSARSSCPPTSRGPTRRWSTSGGENLGHGARACAARTWSRRAARSGSTRSRPSSAATGSRSPTSVPDTGGRIQVDGYEPDPTAAQMRRSVAAVSAQAAPLHARRHRRQPARRGATRAATPAIDSIDLLGADADPAPQGPAAEHRRQGRGDDPGLRLPGRSTGSRSASRPACARRTRSSARSNATSRTGYVYSEESPTRAQPLRAFLFRDRVGYCQQFSGAMALLLRMAGIPTRVATRLCAGEPDARRRRLRGHRPRRPLLGRGLLHGDRLGPVRPDAGYRPGRAAGGTGRPHRGAGRWLRRAGEALPTRPTPRRRRQAAIPRATSAGVPWRRASSSRSRSPPGASALAAWRRAAAVRRPAAPARSGRAVGRDPRRARPLGPAGPRRGDAADHGAPARAQPPAPGRGVPEVAAQGTYEPAPAAGPSRRERAARVRRELRRGWSPGSWLRSLTAMPPGGPRVRRPGAG